MSYAKRIRVPKLGGGCQNKHMAELVLAHHRIFTIKFVGAGHLRRWRRRTSLWNRTDSNWEYSLCICGAPLNCDTLKEIHKRRTGQNSDAFCCRFDVIWSTRWHPNQTCLLSHGGRTRKDLNRRIWVLSSLGNDWLCKFLIGSFINPLLIRAISLYKSVSVE